MGANVAGKPRVFMPYVGGFGMYREHLRGVAADGYRASPDVTARQSSAVGRTLP